jgi:hypothetical protein
VPRGPPASPRARAARHRNRSRGRSRGAGSAGAARGLGCRGGGREPRQLQTQMDFRQECRLLPRGRRHGLDLRGPRQKRHRLGHLDGRQEGAPCRGADCRCPVLDRRGLRLVGGCLRGGSWPLRRGGGKVVAGRRTVKLGARCDRRSGSRAELRLRCGRGERLGRNVLDKSGYGWRFQVVRRAVPGSRDLCGLRCNVMIWCRNHRFRLVFIGFAARPARFGIGGRQACRDIVVLAEGARGPGAQLRDQRTGPVGAGDASCSASST